MSETDETGQAPKPPDESASTESAEQIGEETSEQVSELPEAAEPPTDIGLDDDDFLELHDGKALTPATALPITARRHTMFVVLAGAVSSGKTTLVTSIYESLQNGPFADYLFAGSQTLVGFERRCHDGRLVSGREAPVTERTVPEDEYKLLHLRVRSTSLRCAAQDVLFTDFSGELFSGAKDSTEECRRHVILRRADHFVLFLDGGKLSNQHERHKAVSDAASLLRQCLDANVLGEQSLVDVLFAKWDILSEAFEKEPALVEFLERVQSDKFEQPFQGRVGQLRFSNVAARPNAGSDLEAAYGVAPLFRSWVQEGPSSRIPGGRSEVRNSAREIDRYGLIEVPQPSREPS